LEPASGGVGALLWWVAGRWWPRGPAGQQPVRYAGQRPGRSDMAVWQGGRQLPGVVVTWEAYGIVAQWTCRMEAWWSSGLVGLQTGGPVGL
jgi:hypothetical protein